MFGQADRVWRVEVAYTKPNSTEREFEEYGRAIKKATKRAKHLLSIGATEIFLDYYSGADKDDCGNLFKSDYIK